MNLNEINWGNDSAESDVVLLNYFVESQSYNRLRDGQKNLVIGRKGSGKSALKRKLEDYFKPADNTYVLNISPKFNDIRSILNDIDLTQKFGQEIFFQYTWLRNIYLDCLCAVGHGEKGRFSSGSFEFARSIAEQQNRTSKDIIENISEIISKLKVKAGNLGEFGLAIEKELRNAADLDSLEHHLIQVASDGAEFVVLVDDLDLGWDNSSTANNLILGLLNASKYLMSKVAKSKPYIFLREDVYNIVLRQTQHSDKFRNIEQIRWQKELLINILQKRIEYNYRQKDLSIPSDIFHSVFPATISTSNTDNWLIEHTLSRPRELIQLARYYTEQILDCSPSDDKLKQAELPFSTWKLEDLCTEYTHQYPGLINIFYYWKTKHARRKYTLKQNEINEIILDILVGVELNEPWFNELVSNTDTAKMLEIFYEIGFIGDYVAGGHGGGSRTHYSFDGAHIPRFEEVQIHPCFRKAVNTVERIRS